MSNVITNKSEGYGYNYTSLADIAKAGYEIPVMKTGTEDGREYVYWLMNHPMNISENGVLTDKRCEWIRGAEVIIPKSKQMNEAQMYGAALTYARRYTALMALQLTCSDDDDIESTDNEGNKKNAPKATEKQIGLIESLYDDENIEKILEYYKVNDLEELTLQQASQVISNKKEKKNGKSS